jgi:hypothetical protein
VYLRHPSAELNELFQRRPFQGAHPESAEFVFVGLDANYASDIHQSTMFDDIRAYHSDAIAFWRDRGVHHPFLLGGYGRGAGYLYHQNFAQIGFTPEDADRVSFIELLNVPTTTEAGRKNGKLEIDDLAPAHLDRIDALVTAGKPRTIFLCSDVIDLMIRTHRFGWLRRPPRACDRETLHVLHRQGSTTVRMHLHFSNYGKFQAQLEREAEAIRALVRAPHSDCPHRS